MKKSIVSFSIILIIIFFITNLLSQGKNTDKIEIELAKYKIYKNNRYVSSDISPYIIVNGKYIEDEEYDKKYLKSILGDCPKAFDYSKRYLSLQRKSKFIKFFGNLSSISLGIGGIAYILSRKSQSSKNELLIAGSALLIGVPVVRYVFRSAEKKVRHKAYNKLKMGIDFYDANCYAPLNPLDDDYKRKYELMMDDLHNASFVELKLNLLGLKMGKTSEQFYSGLALDYFKNGFSFSSEIDMALVDGGKKTWEDEYSVGFGISPANKVKSIYGKVGVIIPLLKFLRDYKIIQPLGKSRNIGFNIKFPKGGKKLITWGPILEFEYENSIKKINSWYDQDSKTIIETNEIKGLGSGVLIPETAFAQSITNVSAGLSRTLFISYKVSTNDSRFSSNIVSSTLVSTYVLAKMNVSHEIDDLVFSPYSGNIKIPVTFKNTNYTKYGFAAGIKGSVIKKYFGYGLGIEGGLNPHIENDFYKDYYVKFNVSVVFGKVFK